MPKVVFLSFFFITFALSLMILLALKCSTKESEKSDMTRKEKLKCCEFRNHNKILLL